ncbi:MAG: hypothetical protein KBS89_05895, partial [Bacteroidales bacterium]|nr:hypothetical protein [Candidatus Egerieousia equi]
DIDSKAQYVEVIMNAIDEAEVFLFMYSAAHSQIDDYENDWTIRELNYAKEEGKIIVFIRIDDTPFTKWFKFMFPQKQQVDGQSEYSINALVKDLHNWLKIDSPNYAIIECMNNDLTITLCNNKKKNTSLFPGGVQDIVHIHKNLYSFSKLNNQRNELKAIFVYPTN